MMSSLLDRIQPFRTGGQAVRRDEPLYRFVWRASGVHQLYTGLMAIAVALLNFLPIELQRRLVDDGITAGNLGVLAWLGALYLAAVIAQTALKYVLMMYQGWVGESAVKASRDQIAAVAAERSADDHAAGAQTVNVIGREIDSVGGFVGTSISEFVINLTLLIAVAGYMIYMQPVIALVGGIVLVPQVFLAFFMQKDLNVLVEKQVGLVRELGSEAVRHASATDRKRSHELTTIVAIFRNRIELYSLKYGLKSLLNLANALGPLVVLLAGGYMVLQGQTTIGTIVAFISGLERLSGPLRDLLNFYREYQQATVQHQMIVRWVDDRSGPESGGAGRMAHGAG